MAFASPKIFKPLPLALKNTPKETWLFQSNRNTTIVSPETQDIPNFFWMCTPGYYSCNGDGEKKEELPLRGTRNTKPTLQEQPGI